jgi:hypothetical protein
MDRSSHDVFVSKNQTEVNYLLHPRARAPLHPCSISPLPRIVSPIPYVSVTIVLMVMLILVLVRMLIFRTLVKHSTVHNNGDVMLMLEPMLRDPENVWFFNIFVNIYQSPSRISRTRMRSDSSHHVDSCKSNILLRLLPSGWPSNGKAR